MARRFVPVTFAIMLAVVLSFVAYAGFVPDFVSARGIDKALHAAMGCVLTLALCRALRGRIFASAAVVFAVLAVDEYCQRFSGSRTSDWRDLFADVAGILTAMASASRSRRKAGRTGPLEGSALG